MIKNLPRPDNKHLEAAEGQLELGNHLEANEEFEQIRPGLRVHPLVLELLYKVYSAAKRWMEAVEIADGMSKLLPDNPWGPFHLAYLHQPHSRWRDIVF